MNVQSLVAWLVSVATISGALFAIGFGLYQYHVNSEAAQAKETLDYVKRYYEDPVLASNLRLISFWRNHPTLLETKTITSPNYGQVLNKAYNDQGLTGDIELLISFFQNLHACLCAELCDPALMKEFFFTPAWTLFGQTQPYIEQRRSESDNESAFGEGLVALAQAAHSADTSNTNADIIKLVCSVPGTVPPEKAGSGQK